MDIRLVLIFSVISQGLTSGIPIWELLTHQEKVGNLTFLFLDLVNIYCNNSGIPDCEKSLSLYGISNLMKKDEASLDLLDPNHWDTRNSLWRAALNGVFDSSHQEQQQGVTHRYGTETENEGNTIGNSEVDFSFPNYYDYDEEVGERHPYAVKVPPPPSFQQSQLPQQSSQSKQTKVSEPSYSQRNSNRDGESNIIILMTRELPSERSSSVISSNGKLVNPESKPGPKSFRKEPILFALFRK